MLPYLRSFRFVALIVGVVILSPPAFLAGAIAVTGAPLAIALLIRSVIFEPFRTNGGAMLPTLKIGQYFFASKIAYGYSRYSFLFNSGPVKGAFRKAPQRGDVVVFRFPADPAIIYMMRVVGFPGDRIKMKAGHLYLNGFVIPRTLRDSEAYSGTDGKAITYEETLPSGKSYTITDTVDGAKGDDTEEFLVPAGHYFMLGDNRDNSADSRFDVGFVPEENIYAKAMLIFSEQGRYIWPKWIE